MTVRDSSIVSALSAWVILTGVSIAAVYIVGPFLQVHINLIFYDFFRAVAIALQIISLDMVRIQVALPPPFLAQFALQILLYWGGWIGFVILLAEISYLVLLGVMARYGNQGGSSGGARG